MNSRLYREAGDDFGFGLGQLRDAALDGVVIVVAAGEVHEELGVAALGVGELGVETGELRGF